MKRDKIYLIHILNEINFLLDYGTDIDFEDLIEDEKLSRATIRSLEVIGEASKNISEEFKIQSEALYQSLKADNR